MREIKFRAWIRIGEWDEEGENQAYQMCYDLAFEEYGLLSDQLASIETLMQYTGLKDKNGKEIYEGDIIKNYFGLKCLEVSEEGRKYEGKPKIRQIHNIRNLSNAGILEGMDMNEIEVIGNIYENKELLGNDNEE